MAGRQQSDKDSAQAVASERWTGVAVRAGVLAVALGFGYFIAFGGGGRMGPGLGSVTPTQAGALPGSPGISPVLVLPGTLTAQATELGDDDTPPSEEVLSEDLDADEDNRLSDNDEFRL